MEEGEGRDVGFEEGGTPMSRIRIVGGGRAAGRGEGNGEGEKGIHEAAIEIGKWWIWKVNPVIWYCWPAIGTRAEEISSENRDAEREGKSQN